MSELIASLDKDALNPTKYGENNHNEYTWSMHLQERIVQLYFQLVRTQDISILETKFCEILKILFQHEGMYAKERKMTYKMIAHVRDIVKGKGEYTLSYMMLYNWAKYDLAGAVKMLEHFVMETRDLKEPYGSWKDVKYFADFCRKRNENFSYKLYKYLIGITNIQLIRDNTIYNEHMNNAPISSKLSLCAKWVPRENKKFGWMYEDLAVDYYHREFEKMPDDPSSISFAKMYYRKILTKLNKYIDTVQIKMCKKQWSTINFDHITSITLIKQKYAITFKEKNGTRRTIYDNNYRDKQDRLFCAEKFSKWQSNKASINGKNVSMYDFVKSAIQLSFHPDEELIDVLNKQWNDNGAYGCQNMEYLIPMVDTSGSMSVDNNLPLYNALGLGIRIAEKSKLGKRCLTFSQRPQAMNLILEHIKNVKMESSEVEKLTLVVLSDMQFDESTINNEPIDKQLIEKYEKVGMEICNKPYKIPKIVFWNLRKTNGFPSVSFQSNVCMISGYAPQLISAFIEKGTQSLQDYNSYNILQDILNHPRYLIL